VSPGAGFPGLPDATFRFLAGLAGDNSKTWFDAHREDYQRFYLAPALALVEALGPRLAALEPGVRYEAKVGGSLFRINRDVRFSADKAPYKTHLDLWFWMGERRGWDSPGLFFRLFADRLILGGGMHRFGKPQLEAFRAAVMADGPGRALAQALESVAAAGLEVGGQTRKTVPRGFDPGHPRAGLLRHEGLWAGVDGAVPASAGTPAFADHCLARFEASLPVVRWLATHL
jgi:uncharacterized protein (TIGR02453 family)